MMISGLVVGQEIHGILRNSQQVHRLVLLPAPPQVFFCFHIVKYLLFLLSVSLLVIFDLANLDHI